MTTDKIHIAALAEICRQKNIRHIVLSPGSRSAPLVIAFSQISFFQIHVVPDERVAGFVALGLAQQTQNTVAIICTSGTAVLNLAPAVCEAFHQQVPLLLLTADRPKEYIGIGENQAIDQTNIFKNYCKAFFELPEEVHEAAQKTAQAIHLSRYPFCGPVHLNIPLREPLYRQTDVALPLFHLNEIAVPTAHRFALPETGSTLVLCGLQQPDEQLQNLLATLSERDNIVIIAEPLSNLHHPNFIQQPDLLLAQSDNHSGLIPDTVITIGKQFVSKRLRQFLRKAAVSHHFHISMDEGKWNGIGAAHYHHIFSQVAPILQPLAGQPDSSSGFSSVWKKQKEQGTLQHLKATAAAPFSDLKVFDMLLKSYPENGAVQYGNSSPIRYAGLFAHSETITVYSNRGTSGIDGCLSTAVGAAMARPDHLTICVLGDVSFFYDSNALWTNLPHNLKIVLINNQGGNIFELIEGPKSVDGFEKYFATRHHLTARHLAEMYSLPYFQSDSETTLKTGLSQLFASSSCAVLEITTHPEVNRQVWKAYFE